MAFTAKETKVAWNEIAKVGRPTLEQRVQPNGAPRKFLVRGEYSLACAYCFDDGSGFDLPEDFTEEPVAWTIVQGF